MSFKKNNIKKTSPLIPNLIGIIALCLIFLLGIIFIKNISFFNFKVDTINSLNPNTENELQEIKEIDKNKKNSEKINILVVGRGGGNHDAPDLTDTIILASINTKSKKISMLSIPRDLFVEYEGNDYNGKINGLYAKYSIKGGSQKAGMDILKKKISQITGENINYFINIDFAGFKDIIDTIGGIEINVPDKFVDYQYPNGNWGYDTLVFKEGTWIFDGENALKYARSRHSTSDFDRSIRQQQVIAAIKNKLTGSYFLTSPGKIKELYEVFINHVYTDLNLSTIIKLAYNLNGTSDFKIISSNINDSCFYGSVTCGKGGFLYSPSRNLFGGASVLLTEGSTVNKLNDYTKTIKYTDILFNYPEIQDENYKINIFNSLKVRNLAGILSNNIVRYGFNIPEKKSIGNTLEIYKESVIYYNNIDENSITLRALKSFFKGEFKKTETPMFSTDNANIEIVIGEDYIGDDSLFKF